MGVAVGGSNCTGTPGTAIALPGKTIIIINVFLIAWRLKALYIATVHSLIKKCFT